MNIMKYNMLKFMLLKYIKLLPHENDGIIFNHDQKEYLFGENSGYIKWKPPDLNTLDFYIVPNTKFIDKFGKRVVDLYLAHFDHGNTGNYIRMFYIFAIIS